MPQPSSCSCANNKENEGGCTLCTWPAVRADTEVLAELVQHCRANMDAHCNNMRDRAHHAVQSDNSQVLQVSRCGDR